MLHAESEQQQKSPVVLCWCSAESVHVIHHNLVHSWKHATLRKMHTQFITNFFTYLEPQIYISTTVTPDKREERKTNSPDNQKDHFKICTDVSTKHYSGSQLRRAKANKRVWPWVHHQWDFLLTIHRQYKKNGGFHLFLFYDLYPFYKWVATLKYPVILVVRLSNIHAQTWQRYTNNQK